MKNFIAKALFTVAVTSFGLSMVSCGDSGIADQVEGKWKGDVEYSGESDDPDEKYVEHITYSFRQTDDVIGGGKLDEESTLELSTNDGYAVVSALVDASISAEWDVTMGSLTLKYDLSSLNVSISNLSVRPADPYDEMSREIVSGYDRSELSADFENFAREHMQEKYSVLNELEFFEDLKVEGNQMSFKVEDDTWTFKRIG